MLQLTDQSVRNNLPVDDWDLLLVSMILYLLFQLPLELRVLQMDLCLVLTQLSMFLKTQQLNLTSPIHLLLMSDKDNNIQLLSLTSILIRILLKDGISPILARTLSLQQLEQLECRRDTQHPTLAVSVSTIVQQLIALRSTILRNIFVGS